MGDTTTETPGRWAWQPTEAFRSATNWLAFIQAEGLADYHELDGKAREQPEWFWDALLRHLDIRFRHPYASVLDPSGGLPWP